MGCDVSRAAEVVYADGLEVTGAAVGIGLSCRLCDRTDCRSRAFPPLEHRLNLDPNEEARRPGGSTRRAGRPERRALHLRRRRRLPI
jgi:predicted transcriptional regulator